MSTATLPKYIPIANHPKLVRDTKSRGIINTDINARNRLKMQRAAVLEMRKKLNETTEEVGILKQEMQELKNLVLRKYQINNIVGETA